MTDTRFTAKAAQDLRQAIQAAGGIEVFAVGKLNEHKQVADITVHCRGNKSAVPALITRPKAGDIVIHNHPSGLLVASNADMMLANLYGEDGVGVVIVNNRVTKALWVVEPYIQRLIPVDLKQVQQIFEKVLPSVMPGYEARLGQIDMSLKIAEALNLGEIAVLEAGTGTGKSLAYLVPSILWATQNDTKVVVATYTINLQGQLINSDIPILERAGLKFKHALIKGRSNYICRRRLAIALKGTDAKENHALQAIAEFVETSESGARSDMAFFIEEELWDTVGSDYEQTLRARCPHYESCFFYQARREAAKANILVANHHLLLSDLLIKSETGAEGCMPRYNRVIIDEGHHLENAATSLFQQQLSTLAIRRAISPLMNKKKKTGALEQICNQYTNKQNTVLPEYLRKNAMRLIDAILPLLPQLWQSSEEWFQQIAHDALTEGNSQRRIQPRDQYSPLWEDSLVPVIRSAAHRLGLLSDQLAKLEDILDQLPEHETLKDPQSLLDLRRCRRRLSNHASFLVSYLNLGDPEQSIVDFPTVRWIQSRRKKHALPSAVLKQAPIEVGPTLREKLFHTMKSITACSATMTVNKSFEHFSKRVGLLDGKIKFNSAVFSSPFNYDKQAILLLPTDIPYPNSPDFIDRCSDAIIKAIRASNGGVFILCTSYTMLKNLYERTARVLKNEYRIFRQGEMGRIQLLDAYLNAPNGVLFGADSFWEGVNVKGDQLRMVIIPRLPFRVPTDPVEQARHEYIEAKGGNPFKEYSLPQACLRFRQGFGRLIRTQTDKGAVVIMDSRITSMWYGRSFLQSLPRLKTIRAPSDTIVQNLEIFFKERNSQPSAK